MGNNGTIRDFKSYFRSLRTARIRLRVSCNVSGIPLGVQLHKLLLRKIAASTAAVPARQARALEVLAVDIVGAFAAARIDFGRSRIDPVSVHIEGAEQARFIAVHVGLNSLQRLFGHKKRRLHSAVVPPEPHRVPRRIIRATLIWKIQRHRDCTALPLPLFTLVPAPLGRAVG